MTGHLVGKQAIVTGAAHGLGRATAIRLAEVGARVATLDIDEDGLAKVCQTVSEAGGRATSYVVDITDREAVESVVSAIVNDLGHVDILVNNAGAGWQAMRPFNDTPTEDWEKVLDLNLRGTLYVTQAVLRHMVERQVGRIVNVASIAATTGIPKLAVYSATKGALVSFTKALAMEVGPHHITVNCTSPGLIAADGEPLESGGTFLGRKGTPEEMARLIEFLVSDDASYITGADYLVDGGRTLGPRGV